MKRRASKALPTSQNSQNLRSIAINAADKSQRLNARILKYSPGPQEVRIGARKFFVDGTTGAISTMAGGKFTPISRNDPLLERIEHIVRLTKKQGQ